MNIILTSGRLQKYNGGAKLYNLWVKLLRDNGHEAYIATQDGSYDDWLIEHQPVISYAEVADLADAKIVTGWLDTPGLDAITRGQPFYYFDAELAWTLHFKHRLDHYLARNMIAGVSTHSRYIQAWYMANYGLTPTLINEWSDMDVFYPDKRKRVAGRIGCMAEHWGQLAAAFPGQALSIAGDERQVADAMRSADVFVSLNSGKHPLWGEGCPRSPQEAMHCGCVLVAFDVLGNREYLYDGHTGILVRRGDEDGLIAAIRPLLTDRDDEKERLRQNSIGFAWGVFSDVGKIDLVREFLEL